MCIRDRVRSSRIQTGQRTCRILVPGPFGPNWSLGRSGPIVGPWAVRAHLLDPGPFGPINWALGRSGPLVGHVPGPGAVGMSHVQVGHVPFLFGAHFGSHLGAHFLFGAHLGSHLGTHFGGPGTQVGSVRPPEAEGRLFGGPGAEPPGISPILTYYC